MTSTSADFALLREDVSTPFARGRFGIERKPLKIGKIEVEAMASPVSSCLDMLIKLPGSDVVLPAPYRATFVAEVLDQALSFEDDLLSGWRDTHYVYITVDQRRLVPGKTHRNAGWHFDGMQGARYPVKLDACHQYVVASVLPTEYSKQALNAEGLDELRHNWFVELGAQVSHGSDNVITGQAGDIMLMSAYQLHRSPVAPANADVTRTFVRIDFSLKQQDRLGNSLNPELDAPFEFFERKLPEGLKYTIDDAGWHGASILVN
jgi:hypothetical protein|nr:hypothetical protein [Neorhizobium tomejilense]